MSENARGIQEGQRVLCLVLEMLRPCWPKAAARSGFVEYITSNRPVIRSLVKSPLCRRRLAEGG